MSRNLNFLFGWGSVGGASYWVAKGVRNIADYLTQFNSIRDTIYLRATEITPELIQQTSDISDSISRGNLNLGIAQIVVAGLTGAMAYSLLRE